MADRERRASESYNTASRENNPNWRGGRSITSHGYTLIRVGKDHPLADVRGYAYEHRLVARANLGRELEPGEEIHHWDSAATQNNDWSNLEPCASRAEHFLHHRSEKNKDRLRMPGQSNEMIPCGCGCGERFLQFDQQGRPRFYLPNHNRKEVMSILANYAGGPYDCAINFFGARGRKKSDETPFHAVRAPDAVWSKTEKYQASAARFRAEHHRPRRVVVNEIVDFFDTQAEDEWRWAACARMEAAPDVIFILVTKRPQLVSRMVPGHWMKRDGWPANVWMLTTAENQTEYDRRVPWLLTLPAPVLGVSMEPLLEIIGPYHSISASNHERAAWVNTRLKGKLIIQPDDVGRLAWVIVGGESGAKARVMPSLWELTGMIGQLASSRVAVFVKQLSQREYPKTFKDRATFPRGLKRAEHPYHAN